MKAYLVPARHSLGFYLTSNHNNALIQRDEWAAKDLDAAVINPTMGADIDLADADGVDLTIEDTRKRYGIKVLDSETISDDDRQDFLHQLLDNVNVFGDVKEIREIKKAFGA